MGLKRFLLMIFVVVAQLAAAQNISTNKLDEYFQALEQNNRFMGSLSVFKDGHEIYNKQIGYAKVDPKIKADKNSIYGIGSISKTYTATLIFKAIESGKLTLNQTLDNFFPSIKNANKITIEQLLRHRSGIHNFTDNSSFAVYYTQNKSRKEMISEIEKGGSDFEPNAKMNYSNSNFLLLSYILEDVYKKPFGEILDIEIIKPLGLKNTNIGTNILFNNICNSYIYLDRWTIRPRTHSSVMLGTGGVLSTPHDLNIFANALFTQKIIGENSLKQMMSIVENVGMGLMKMPFYERWGYGHLGSIDGFESIFIYFPEDKVSCSIVSNGLNYPLNDISIAVSSWVFDKPFDIPVYIASEDLDKYVGVYSSPQMPIKITITKKGKVLVAQGDGQPAFDLEAVEKDKFKFYPGRIEIDFNPEQNSLTLKQSGYVFVMKR